MKRFDIIDWVEIPVVPEHKRTVLVSALGHTLACIYWPETDTFNPVQGGWNLPRGIVSAWAELPTFFRGEL